MVREVSLVVAVPARRCKDGRMTGLNLPTKCGVMLLPDCTLFPHGGLPLFIFEERYRIMLDEALAGECVFAVGRMKENAQGEVDRIAQMGTAGLVRASREREDGTSQLLLHGVIRVRFQEWLEEKPYPYARIEPVMCEPIGDRQGAAAMKTLRGAVEDGIAGLPADVRAGVMALLDQADEPGLMADLVAQQFVHDVDLRQELLETAPVGERVRILCEFFQRLKNGG
jgi:ATP-dependent Lon protease